MDAKLKWWEKLATKGGAKTDKKEPPSNENEIAASEEGQDAAAVGAGQGPDAPRPGAIAVRGPEYRGSGFDDTSTIQGGGGRGGGDRGGRGNDNNDNGNGEAPPIHVDSYVVRDSLTDEEIRQRILAGTAHAEEVDKTELQSKLPPRRRRRNAAIAILIVVVVAAVAVGVAVPLSNQQPSGPSAQHHDESVVASFKYLEFQGSGGFANAIFAETKKLSEVEGGLTTSGAMELIRCKPKVCMTSNDNCRWGNDKYVPGCCAGPDCPNETKCGEQCPPPPESCYLTDPTNETCIRSECYTCHQVDGQETYVLRDFAFSIDCLEVGTAIRPDNGLEYKWAIYCGPMTVGPVVEENKDLGEYQCGAVRLGANFSDDDGGGGLFGGNLPCQFIALAECGCGPSDIYPWGLPEPAGLCQPDGGCPFLCEGVGGGNEFARNLCRSFPGNISWWEGRNVFNGTLFAENMMAPEYEFELYIKGVD